MITLSKTYKHVGPTLLLVVCAVCLGCGGDQPPADDVGERSSAASGTAPAAATEDNGDAAEKKTFRPVNLGSFGPESSGVAAGKELSAEQKMRTVLDELKPLQIVLGTWRGTTRKKHGGFQSVDETKWVFDLQTDRQHPALRMTSDKSPYLKSARLTYLPVDDRFQLQIVDAQGVQRQLDGEFLVAVQDVPGDGKKLQRTYKLQFTQSELGQAPDFWQLVFNQQENDRYLLQLAKKRRKAAKFALYDTVATQREGTSFALSDTDYGEKECIISQGLGTTQVSYQGKTYWVCCSGCAAAFNDDPEMWIAEAAKREKAKTQAQP